jgi:hypothetical protein
MGSVDRPETDPGSIPLRWLFPFNHDSAIQGHYGAAEDAMVTKWYCHVLLNMQIPGLLSYC